MPTANTPDDAFRFAPGTEAGSMTSVSSAASNGLAADERLLIRKERSAPLLTALETWLREQRSRVSRSTSVAEPIDYMLKRWNRFARFIGDDRICLSNPHAVDAADPSRSPSAPAGDVEPDRQRHSANE
jgi:hypothetical protein